jgi:hypothetical protein
VARQHQVDVNEWIVEVLWAFIILEDDRSDEQLTGVHFDVLDTGSPGGWLARAALSMSTSKSGKGVVEHSASET